MLLLQDIREMGVRKEKVMIDMSKKYRTFDGQETRIFLTDAGGQYPVLRATKTDQGWSPKKWTEDGKILAAVHKVNGLDLVEVKTKHVRWVNFNESTCVTGGYTTRERADQEALQTRIACIRIEFEEGEGLT